MKKYKKIENYLKTTITEITITDANNQTPKETQDKLIELLKPVVTDKEILNIITQPTNIEKIKHRLEHIITIKNEAEETLITAKKFNANTYNIIQEIQQNLKPKTEITTESPDNTTNLLKLLHYQVQPERKNGIINRIKVQIIFRKTQ